MTKQYPLILPIPYSNKTRTLYLTRLGQIPSPTSPQQPSSSLPPLPPIGTNPNNTTLPSNQSLLGPQVSPTPSLNGTDMTGGNMTGGNMTGGNMTGGNMTGGNMTGGNMTGGNMTGGNMTYTNNGTDFTGGNMTATPATCLPNNTTTIVPSVLTYKNPIIGVNMAYPSNWEKVEYADLHIFISHHR